MSQPDRMDNSGSAHMLGRLPVPIEQFNKLVVEFVGALHSSFGSSPVHGPIMNYAKNMTQALFQIDPTNQNFLKQFTIAVSGHWDEIEKKDPVLFDEVELFSLNLRAMYDMSDANSRACIWEYLNAMLLIGASAGIMSKIGTQVPGGVNNGLPEPDQMMSMFMNQVKSTGGADTASTMAQMMSLMGQADAGGASDMLQ